MNPTTQNEVDVLDVVEEMGDGTLVPMKVKIPKSHAKAITKLIEAERLRASIKELEKCTGFSYKRLRLEELKAELEKLND